MVDVALKEDRIIARKLRRAWPTFFGPFGRLTPIQRKAIIPIFEGGNALVISATASGKTEAVCAPLVERFIDKSGPWTILYISPTRALVNDLYQRLFPPLNRLSLTLKRRTGDYHDDLSGANVLLTTPESFDSLLCRGRTNGKEGHVLANVVAIVLDEIHLLHGNARGEQPRWLIERLRRLRKQANASGWAKSVDFQVVALSATVPDPDSIVANFLGKADVIRVEGGRTIEVVPSRGIDLPTDEALISYLTDISRSEKILVFANSRKRADRLGGLLKDPLGTLGYQVAVHHGSLAQGVREATETAMRNSEKIVVCATSTLEIGIDIGDIDLVVLDGPAPDLKALLQRIGRGNRRTDHTRVMACAGSTLEVIVHSAMIQAVEDGWLGESDSGPEFAVARQQVASYIFQSPSRSRSRGTVENLLDTCSVPEVTDGLIDEMLLCEELVEDESGIRLGEELLEKSANGQIHSNIEGVPGVTVVDEETGQQLASGIRPGSIAGPSLGVGGNILEPRSWDRQKLEVRKLKASGQAEGNWGYISKGWYKGSDQPQAVKRYLGIPDDVWPVIKIGGMKYVFHFGGSRRKAFLQLAASSDKVKVTEWFISLSDTASGKPAWAHHITDWRLDSAVSENLDSLERTLNRPKANQILPLAARQEEIRQWLSLEEELHELQYASWDENVEVDLAIVLMEIVNLAV